MDTTTQIEKVSNTSEMHKPPPIFIQTQVNYENFCKKMLELTGNDGFECKSTLKAIKLSTYNSDSYRKVVKFLQDGKVSFHTYQSKENKPFKVVIRNLHHSTDIQFIKDELFNNGFTIRNISNVQHKQTKVPLPIFFVDIEPAPNNSDIFKLTSLCYTKIKVETPHPKKDMPQCLRCQAYGHTRTYCNHSPRCVRCGEHHNSNECTKDRNSPAKCALCSGAHPANYKGCPSHKELQKTKNNKAPTENFWFKNKHSQNIQQSTQAEAESNPSTNKNIPKANKNFGNNSSNNSHLQNQTNAEPDFNSLLSSFISDLKALINPLISLLTTVIDKLIKNA